MHTVELRLPWCRAESTGSPSITNPTHFVNLKTDHVGPGTVPGYLSIGEHADHDDQASDDVVDRRDHPQNDELEEHGHHDLQVLHCTN
ncbi:hypothetical protein EYF80_001528 [Liparis tanakae]|uniref:Uncharacterized protein n=1 Tax=Liparis tanakae TaxID=230148 RepID=A0A4Z2JGB1_9TELE|nr:hypothetical protein EYF80_001528 [Liparis tanakae]